MAAVAVQLAQQGFRIFPLRTGFKLPWRKGWKAAATSDPFGVLNSWPGDHYAPGIATGADFTIIDVEAAGIHTDPIALKLPPTRTHETASGGEHYVYRTPLGLSFANSVKKIAANTDVRGEGGLAVAPGGYIRDKKTGALRYYRIKRDLPIAELPAHLVELLRAAPVRAANAGQVIGDLDTPNALKRATEYLADKGPRGPGHNVLPGSRGAAAYKASCRLGDLGTSPPMAYELLLHWNETGCTPPQDLDELASCAENAYRYRQDPIGRDNP